MQEIYIALLDEGSPVWRPAKAIPLEDGIYRITSENGDPEDELWEFVTGDAVRCTRRVFSDGATRLVAIEKVLNPSK
jgi:hypothetical protein